MQILNCVSELGTCCSDFGLAATLNIVRNILTIIQIVVPLILIVMSTVSLTKMVINPDEKKVITPEFIVSVVADHYELTAAQLKGGERSKKIAYPRQIAMYLSRELAQASLKDIGDALGGRDHSTVLHGCNKIEEDLKEDTKLKNVIEILTRKINPDE